jgi:L-cysteine S-thiosulfotransferase
MASVFLLAAGCSTIPVDRMDGIAPPGDAARGREVFLSRDAGHCVICHVAPGVEVAGNVGPSLAGVGSRLDAGQIRLRVVDITRAIPDATMPAFHRTENLRNVASTYRGKPVLAAQQVEDVVAFLATLK